MPDFERHQDSLRLHMVSKDPVERARVEGFIHGKSRARKEILVVSLLLAVTCTAWLLSMRGV